MFKRLIAALAAVSLVALVAPAAVSAAPGTSHVRTYEVTITNLTSGQPFTPPVVAVHQKPVHIFQAGHQATPELQQLAENGNLPPLLATLDPATNAKVSSIAPLGGPLVPAGLPGSASFGDSVTVTVTAEPGAQFLSVAAMLICTNDGFTGVDGIHLPNKVGRSVTVEAGAYDAGTEINTEDFADLVPPCQGLVGISSGDSGTGMSDAALAEGGTVGHHEGVQEIDDLTALHDWDGAVAQITIVRVD